ncbi:MAG: 4-hydroxy-tetrahydrodipicolinate reductase [Clostridia bacterium]|nr:4-hydroxy-tetrahydrodipicolinate reductase [Clostridia bacterium]
MTKIILSGCNGKMGQVISRLLKDDETARIVCGLDINTTEMNGYPVVDDLAKFDGKADVVIDFSHPSTLDKLIEYCSATGTALVMATTGLSSEQVDRLNKLSESVAVFRSANMSLGINLLIDLVKKAAQILEGDFDIEVVEKHHNQKIDAPSGTALMIADAMTEVLKNKPEYVYDRHSVRKKRSSDEIGIHAVRGGTIVGEHEVIFAGNDEIIEIKHTAMSKEVFAVGSIRAAKFISGKEPGMYCMQNMI